LLIVSVRVLMRISACKASNWELLLLLGWILNWATKSVRLVVRTTSLISIDSCRAISLVVSNSCSVRAIDRNLIVVGAKSVSVCVRIGEESALEHLVS